MAKKYIDIEETRGEPTFKDEKHDVIFYYSYYDRWYDHVGESLGNFYDVGYEVDGEKVNTDLITTHLAGVK